MKLNILPQNILIKDLLLALLLSLLLTIFLVLLSILSPTNSHVFVVYILCFLIIGSVKYLERTFKADQNKSNNILYKQLQAYIYLQDRLDLSQSLPPLTGSAISPDLGNILIDKISEIDAKQIVECGSGVSTIISSSVLKKSGKGKVYSLDHETKFAKITEKNLINNQLNKFANVIYAPIKEYKLKNKPQLFYDISSIENIENIDILFVDGPPRTINPMIRYSALPLLIKKIRKNGLIILDDANRKAEKEIVKLWLKEYPNLEYEYIPTEKGTVILTKIN